MTYQDQLHLHRHDQYEKRFSLSFQRVLKANYYQIARNLEDGRNLDEIDSTNMQRAYTRLYLSIMSSEGILIWNDLVAPLTGERFETKDVFDELASTFAPDKMSEMKPFWAKLMTGYLNTYIIQRVTEVTGTTVRRVTDFIERGRNRGLTNQELARMIRADARSRELRANTISRTEATNAMAKSQILALKSSGLNWEKAWSAIKDQVTRQDHFDTDPDNWISIDGNFIIGGFQMAFPGDSSQGAPLREIVRCRCRLRFRLAGRGFGFRPVQRRVNT